MYHFGWLEITTHADNRDECSQVIEMHTSIASGAAMAGAGQLHPPRGRVKEEHRLRGETLPTFVSPSRHRAENGTIGEEKP